MLSVRQSKIHGRGCFTDVYLRPATLFPVPAYEVHRDGLQVVHCDDEMFRLYRPFNFLNHSVTPNCELLFEGGKFYLYVLQELPPNTELTIHYGEDWND